MKVRFLSFWFNLLETWYLFILIAAVRGLLIILARPVEQEPNSFCLLAFHPLSQFLPKAGNMFGFDEFQKIASKPWRACWRRVCSVPCECAQTERQISRSLGEILPSSQVSRVLFSSTEIENGKGLFFLLNGMLEQC